VTTVPNFIKICLAISNMEPLNVRTNLTSFLYIHTCIMLFVQRSRKICFGSWGGRELDIEDNNEEGYSLFSKHVRHIFM
jgi:hypothetical protein